MIKNTNVLVVVLTRNYSTGLSVIRSLGHYGYVVDVVASAKRTGMSKLALCSKYVRNSVEVVSDKVKSGGDDELLAELLKYREDKATKKVLFPTDDYTASIMDMNRDILRDIFIMPGLIDGNQGSLTESMNKTVQSRIARESGLPVPEECIISLRDEEICIPDGIAYPCFCKPIESISGYKGEMKKCDNDVELKGHLHFLRSRFAERDVLIQEYLEIDSEIDLSGLCFDQEVIIPAIIRKTRVAQYERGVTLAGMTCDFEELSELRQSIVNMLQKYRYYGMFDMELNVVGDKIYFNEINFRSGGPNFTYFRSGVNLPSIFVRRCLGEIVSEEEKKVKEYGKTFIYEKVAWDDYLHGHITRKELNETIEAADITLLKFDIDPEPWNIFISDMLEKEERKKKKDDAICVIEEHTGWCRTFIEKELAKIKAETGLGYRDYVKHEFWKLDAEQRIEKAQDIRRKKERQRKRKEDCITSTIGKTGWSREYAEEQIKDARARLGITYKDYDENDFCLVPVKKQERLYNRIQRKRK